jgi:hypothetical protein
MSFNPNVYTFLDAKPERIPMHILDEKLIILYMME